MTVIPVHDTDAVYALTPSPVDQAMEAARAGHVAWLTEQEREVLAVLPAGLAHAALEALDEAEEDAQAAAWAERNRDRIAAMRLRRAAGEKGTPLEQIEAELDHAGAAHTRR